LPVTLQPITFARTTEHLTTKRKKHPPEQGKTETPKKKSKNKYGGTLKCLLMYSFSEFLLIDRGWQKFFIIFFRIFGKIIFMAIPQMKKKKVEMVETEMGRMVPKAAQQKFEKEAGEALDKAVSSPYKMAMAERAEKMKAKAAREIVFKRGREAVETPLKRKMGAMRMM